MKNDDHLDAAQLRRKAEEVCRGRDAGSPEDFAALSPEKIHGLVHELRVHQLELVMQNEELRQTQVDLAVSQERYFELFDLAPLAYCILSEKDLIQETNLTAAALLGATSGCCFLELRRRWSEFRALH